MKDTINEMKVTIQRYIAGFGLSSSAAIGEQTVKVLATKLHIPIAVALYNSGKTVSLLNDA